MERNLQKNGLINLLTLLVVGVAGFAVARFATRWEASSALYSWVSDSWWRQ